jgi:hypothetical protein
MSSRVWSSPSLQVHVAAKRVVAVEDSGYRPEIYTMCWLRSFLISANTGVAQTKRQEAAWSKPLLTNLVWVCQWWCGMEQRGEQNLAAGGWHMYRIGRWMLCGQSPYSSQSRSVVGRDPCQRGGEGGALSAEGLYEVGRW